VDLVDPRRVVPAERLRLAGVLAAVSVLVFVVIGFFGRGVLRDSLDAVAFAAFPSRVTLEVTPGNVRARRGSTLTIEARLAGSRAPVGIMLLRTAPDADSSREWPPVEMVRGDDGDYTLELEVNEPFRYQVVAASVSSDVFDVSVTRPPRVTRIDLDYLYPQALRLEPRTDEDAGDIYAPAGTDVRLRVHVDGDAQAGHLALDDGSAITLTEGDGVLTGALTVARNGTYHVALRDTDGIDAAASAEYFIRTLDDRPPEVQVIRPARDREVTALEEVEIEVEARDDFGLDRLDLVYTVGSGSEVVVPLRMPRQTTSVTTGHTLYLEDLKVAPGDFVSYYVRARDVRRTTRASDARSDIFFLQVRPFEQQFRLANTQAGGGTGESGSIDDLVAAQKEIIVATWKLDRRGETAGQPAAEQDIRAVARAEAEVKTRVEQSSSARRTQTLRSPRRIGPGGPTTGRALPGEDALTAASEALGRAVTALERLRTADALPAEMEALDHLLKAQADVQERQITRQQAGPGGGNRTGQDLSGLFDRELQQEQRTNYEDRERAGQQPQEAQSEDLLARVRELARRQDELLREQRELQSVGNQLTEAERQRQLERLTREQAELSQRAEQLSREMAQGQQSQGQAGGGTSSSRMRSASESMRSAAEGMRQSSSEAVARGARALDELRRLERELQAGTPGERQRALASLQFEARELADAQRELGQQGQSRQSGRQETAEERGRRLAGDQQRLAERLERLQSELEQQGAAPSAGRQDADADLRQAAVDAAREIGRQQLVDRMQQEAERLRASDGSSDPAADSNARSAKQSGAEIAGALDQLADRLAAASGSNDPEARRMTTQLARAQELRNRMERATRELERLDRESQQPTGPAGGDRAASVREEIERQLKDAQALLDELRRENPDSARGGMGFTFEGQGMVQSAPGTEAFKQDLSRWEELRKQVTGALEAAEASVAARLRARESQDRLAAGLDDRLPVAYQPQVDSYFKALADMPVR
jgi:hypothetical protein